MNAMELSTLQVGQEVGIADHTGRHARGSFGKVEGINGHGHIRVVVADDVCAHQIVFDKHGEERGKKYGPRRLSTPESLREILSRQAAQRERNAAASTFGQLVESTLRGRKNGYGDFSSITPEEKAALVAALDALPVESK